MSCSVCLEVFTLWVQVVMLSVETEVGLDHVVVQLQWARFETVVCHHLCIYFRNVLQSVSSEFVFKQCLLADRVYLRCKYSLSHWISMVLWPNWVIRTVLKYFMKDRGTGYSRFAVSKVSYNFLNFKYHNQSSEDILVIVATSYCGLLPVCLVTASSSSSSPASLDSTGGLL